MSLRVLAQDGGRCGWEPYQGKHVILYLRILRPAHECVDQQRTAYTVSKRKRIKPGKQNNLQTNKYAYLRRK